MGVIKTCWTFLLFIAINSVIFYSIILIPDFLSGRELLFSFHFESKKATLLQLINHAAYYLALLTPVSLLLFALIRPFSLRAFTLSTAALGLLTVCSMFGLYLMVKPL